LAKQQLSLVFHKLSLPKQQASSVLHLPIFLKQKDSLVLQKIRVKWENKRAADALKAFP
jgi:hypothetical protein